MASETEIKQAIEGHMAKCGGTYREWYVGIAADPRDRLFNGHGVREKGDAWILRRAESAEVARRVERYFVKTLGTDGGPGGGDASTKAVYAYKKNAHTSP